MLKTQKKQTRTTRTRLSPPLVWNSLAKARVAALSCLKRRRIFWGLLVMGDEKSSSSTIMASRDREPRDRELLIPVADSTDEDASFKPSSSSSISHHTGREVNFYCCLLA
ncbi:protein LIKE COV 1-like [Prunus yedoensis var. nudiflora]|uniref:Protein LIKE COV 1-like n=1 Tax=Prunus yedoensis var. nudiflora TaxID=2094558 RepID=A0A314Z4H6_PRUYE|nr:protein LIKE COV 1-like [Prunus yedoensis var. nudiflora]